MVSEYARTLQSLLDDSNIFSRQDWSKIFYIDIDKWVKEEVLPRPYQLHMTYDMIENSSKADQEPLKIFKEMAQRPSTKVSEKYGKLMLPSVWDYMHRPAFCNLSSELAELDKKAQEDLFVAMNEWRKT